MITVKITTVSQYLQGKYDIKIKAGRKGECPFCHHKDTFAVKKDDSLGHCFRPYCDKSITLSYINNKGADIMLNNLTQEIYKDFKVELKEGSESYKYLISRGIHNEVIKDSMLGCVPYNYDVDSLFDKYIDEIKNKLEISNKKGEKEALQEGLSKLVELKEKFREYLTYKEGALVFFYSDKWHKITRIKVRKPFTKCITIFVFDNSVSGVFNHQLFSEQEDDELSIGDNLMIMEGEFNSLQLQSLMKRQGLEYVNACSIGGVQGADFSTLSQLSNKWLICYDNDQSQAGFSLVENALSYKSVEAFTTPKVESDLDSFIISFQNDNNKAFESLKELIQNKIKYFKSVETIKDQINEIRDNRAKHLSHRLDQTLSEVIRNEILDRSKLFYDKN